MNDLKKSLFNISDVYVSKQVAVKSSWWTRFLNWLRKTESKDESYFTVKFVVQGRMKLTPGMFFIPESKSLYKVVGSIGSHVIARSINPLEEHGLTSPCLIVSKPKAEGDKIIN
jgi:hypothetical protein